MGNALNEHFTNIAKSYRKDQTESQCSTFTSPTITREQLSRIPCLSQNDITLMLKNIQISKTTERNQLSACILWLALPCIIQSMTIIINQAISEATFPTQ